MFDTELIRLARLVMATLPADVAAARLEDAQLPPPPREGDPDAGDADVSDLAIAAWDGQGRLLLADREGAVLGRRRDQSGFVDEEIAGEPWRVYYLHALAGGWLVATGQKQDERDELVYDVSLGQLLPWIVMLPVLMVAMAWAVRRALAPMQDVAGMLQRRAADDLTPLPVDATPGELQPLLVAMNALFLRISEALAHERRFTVDAAHELRTPLAALRAQWDVLRRAQPGPARAEAERRLAAGLDRMDRLVTQLLTLSRVDAVRPGTQAASRRTEVDWRALVEDAVADCLGLAERRRIEIDCAWPADERRALPLLGNEHLLAVMLRNLLDNAVRYATEGSTVRLRFEEAALTIDNDGPPLAASYIDRLGDRFHRPEGQMESGSGLGVSIARRVAELHGLALHHAVGPDGRGITVRLGFWWSR